MTRDLRHPGVRIVAVAGAALLSLLVATQNHFALRAAGRDVSWLEMFLLELPVWYSWVALLPVVVALSRRFPPAGPRPWRNVAVHLVAGLALVFLSILAVTAIRWPFQDLPPDLGFWTLTFGAYRQTFALFVIVYGALVTAAVAWRYHVDAQARELRESQLAASLSEARLDALRAQIHPHFLFNTLHAISGLMARDVPGARRMITRLSELLRLSLEDEAAHEVPLQQELDFLDRYADIQRMRFGERLSVEYDVAPEARGLCVPRLVLQPLVENAIQHGVARRAGPGRVRIEAGVVDRTLELRVRDDGPGFGADGGSAPGVGIRNTRARLEQLYGERHHLMLESPSEGGALVRVGVPLRPCVDEEG